MCARGQDRSWYFEEEDRVRPFNPDADYGAVLTLAGVFPSITAAHKHGFAGAIPEGWNTIRYNGWEIHLANRGFTHR